MTEFKGDGEISFGTLGYLSHLFIALSVLLVCVGLLALDITGKVDPYSYWLGIGGIGVIIGVILGFSNVFVAN